MHRQQSSVRAKGFSICGESLRNFRLSRGLTQSELARRAGYSERLVRKAEAGGSLSQATIEDLADALSSDQKLVTINDLCSSPEAIARNFVECYDEHEELMLDYCGHLLSDGFVFHCAGEPGTGLAGDWKGKDGFQAWLDQLFSIVTRPQRKCLQPSYLTAGENVTAHYCDTLQAIDHSLHVMWVNLHFTIRQGRIETIIDEYDISVATRILNCSERSAIAVHPR